MSEPMPESKIKRFLLHLWYTPWELELRDFERYKLAPGFIAGAEWQASRKVEVTDATFSQMMANLDRLGRETVVALIAELRELDADMQGELGTDVASRAAAALDAALGGGRA